ncbi:MAG: SatD family protein [Candidatus Izemoplasmatales bacterium]|jgi:hypothetical protein|nr:SatD family protein [Candidatus Izemoplasmatales bacterium]MDD5293460.1 SatD family protein [Candidatus Izemoplasmatales bacterium]
MVYYAINGDVIDSKHSDTLAVFQHMSRVLNDMNTKYKKDIAKPFEITLGDEFQGLLKTSDHVFEIIEHFRLAFDHIQLRYGVGVGEVPTGLGDTRTTLGTNGDAWWLARQATSLVKSYHEKGISGRTDLWVLGIEDPAAQTIINHMIVLLHNIRRRWTRHQTSVIGLLMKDQGYDDQFIQEKTAQKLGQEPKNFNKLLRASQYYDYVQGYQKITAYLKGVKS